MMADQLGLWDREGRPEPGTVLFVGLEAIRAVYGEGAYSEALGTVRSMGEARRLVRASAAPGGVAVPVTPPLGCTGATESPSC